MMSLFAAALAAGAGPGTEHVFGDWAVACDNVKGCTATMLMPEGWRREEAPGINIFRDPGPAGEMTIMLNAVTKADGVTDILIDRRLVGSGVLRAGTIWLKGGTAEGLARAMATGHAVTLRQRTGVIVTLSLTGVSAALRYIDAEQGRAGTITALVAHGPKPATSVPAALPAPRVVPVRPGKGKPATIPAEQIAALRTRAGCDQASNGPEPAFFRLDSRTTLVAIPCTVEGDQVSSALFVVSGGRAAPAPFDFPPDWGEAKQQPVPTLIEPVWYPSSAEFGSGARSPRRDCGKVQSWVWDGSRFRMTQYNALDVCRKSGGWLQRYHANVAK